jgi:hypothetical protein
MKISGPHVRAKLERSSQKVVFGRLVSTGGGEAMLPCGLSPVAVVGEVEVGVVLAGVAVWPDGAANGAFDGDPTQTESVGAQPAVAASAA